MKLGWRARIPLLLLALLAVGGPVAYYTWYATAARVTATVTTCERTANRGCHGAGTWTMPDGSHGSGSIEGTGVSDVGHTFPARATRTRALVGGPLSGPGALAALFLLFDLIAAAFVVVVVVLHRRARRRGPPPPPPTALIPRRP